MHSGRCLCMGTDGAALGNGYALMGLIGFAKKLFFTENCWPHGGGACVLGGFICCPCTREGVVHGAPDGADLGQWLCSHGANLVLLKNCFSLKIVGLMVVVLAFSVVSLLSHALGKVLCMGALMVPPWAMAVLSWG
ncbi:hypothetical protein SLA2020_277300 [Shorea laevis]